MSKGVPDYIQELDYVIKFDNNKTTSEDVFNKLEFLDKNMKEGVYLIEKLNVHQIYTIPLNLETLHIDGWVTFEQPVKFKHCIISKHLYPDGVSSFYHTMDEVNFSKNVIFLSGLHCDNLEFI